VTKEITYNTHLIYANNNLCVIQTSWCYILRWLHFCYKTVCRGPSTTALGRYTFTARTAM